MYIRAWGAPPPYHLLSALVIDKQKSSFFEYSHCKSVDHTCYSGLVLGGLWISCTVVLRNGLEKTPQHVHQLSTFAPPHQFVHRRHNDADIHCSAHSRHAQTHSSIHVIIHHQCCARALLLEPIQSILLLLCRKHTPLLQPHPKLLIKYTCHCSQVSTGILSRHPIGWWTLKAPLPKGLLHTNMWKHAVWWVESPVTTKFCGDGLQRYIPKIRWK